MVKLAKQAKNWWPRTFRIHYTLLQTKQTWCEVTRASWGIKKLPILSKQKGNQRILAPSTDINQKWSKWFESLEPDKIWMHVKLLNKISTFHITFLQSCQTESLGFPGGITHPCARLAPQRLHWKPHHWRSSLFGDFLGKVKGCVFWILYVALILLLRDWKRYTYMYIKSDL